jgi:serine/threonine-protein kinase
VPTLRDQLQRTLGETYALDREIGRGGMATVYLARDGKHHRHVALKVLDPELGAVLGAERFLSEIRVTAGLQHPNLLPLFDSGESGGLLYYVMPYVEGESLRHRLDREKQLPVEEAVRIAVAVANALDYAHGHGVIHRDLKPENILLQHGQPVVADFGIALAVSNAGGARITQTGLSLGTPQYMSPEQATGDRVIDGRTDVYSLAAVTYEMLTGEPPHSGSSAQAIIAKLMTSAPQPVRALRPSVAPHVAMAVEHGLEKLPADRFATAKAFADALTNPSFTTGTSTVTSAVSQLPRASGVVWMLSALSVVSIAAALWGWLRPSEPKPVLRYTLVPDSSEALITTARWGRIALSPDGSILVYVGGPRNALLVRRRDELTARPLPGTENAGAPAFSPDGRRVAFIQNARTLKIASLDGSPAITVTDSLTGLSGLSWGNDNMIYADGLGSAPLVRLAARAGARTERFVALDSAAHERDQVYPHVLPGNRGILYTSSRPSGASRGAGIAILEPGSFRPRILVENATRAVYAASGHIVYSTPEGALMAAPFDVSSGRVTGDPVVIGQGLSPQPGLIDFTVSRSGTLAYIAGTSAPEDRELVWVSRTGEVEVLDSAWHAPFTDPAISPDGKLLAISTGGIFGVPTGDIWIKRLGAGGGAIAKFTVEGGYNRFPVWLGDGKTLRYSSAVADTFWLVDKPADGSGPPARRFAARDILGNVSVTPDDQWVVFTEGPAGEPRIYARRANDTSDTPIVPDGSGRTPALSPDGKWLAYAIVVNGTSSIYVSPFPNVASAKWLVSPDGGSEPVWSHSGKELFYRRAGMLVSVAVSATSAFSFGMPKPLFPDRRYTGRYAVAPDDSRFLMVRRLDAASSARLTIVENWVQDLSRRPRP